MLVLHIGLGKTGSTTLQRAVFAPAKGITYVHRKRGAAAAALTQALSGHVRVGPLGSWGARRALLARIQGFDTGAGTILVSHEGTAIGQAEFWTGRGPAPARVVRRLAALGRALPERLRPLQSCVRHPPAGSLARLELCPQGGRPGAGFDQPDFDRRMWAIAEAPALEGPLDLLDFAAARRELVAALGAENGVLSCRSSGS